MTIGDPVPDTPNVDGPAQTITQQLRITSVEHVITSGPTDAECKWLMTVTFAGPDTVPPPQQTPALPAPTP